MFAIRGEILKEIISDPWWKKELEVAKTTDQKIEVLVAYCREKGYRVNYVELGGKKDEGK